LCWWPLAIEPNLDLPWWVPLLCIAVGAFLSTVLGPGESLWVPVASAIGTFFGLCAGTLIWWPSDPIARPWVPIIVAVDTTLAGLVATVAGVAGRRVRLSAKLYRLAAWLALVGCVAFGPVALALTPPLVAHRIAINDQLAAERFASLKKAVQATASDPRDHTGVCDGLKLMRHYSGPRFNFEDWHRITGNYVTQDGYVFMVYCREQGGYTIDAWPTRVKGDGTRHFCTDESGSIGCGMMVNRSRHACTPCAR
jgi:hypothetical protein